MLRSMTFSLSIIALTLAYMWIAVPALASARDLPDWLPGLAIAAILGLCAGCHLRRGCDWGFRGSAMAPGLAWALGLTLPVTVLVLAVGRELGTLRVPEGPPQRLIPLLLWALAQQFVLQTVIFREARQAMSERAAVMVAAGLFALVHLPNPVLVPATFLAGMAWCALYRRHPNLLPIALSHAAASLAVMLALGPDITGGMRVGYGYFRARAASVAAAAPAAGAPAAGRESR